MKMTHNTTFLVSTCITSVAVISYFIYRIVRNRIVVTDILDNADMQRINQLSLKAIIDWLDNVVGDKLNEYVKIHVDILPNTATKDALKGALKISKKDLDRCILIVIVDETSKQVIKRKLVIPNSISDDLFSVRNGKIFEIPVE